MKKLALLVTAVLLLFLTCGCQDTAPKRAEQTAEGMIMVNGLVNTVSAKYPLGDPHKDFDPEDIPTGTWNVYPVQDGDHMFLQGGLFHKHDIRPFYLELLETIRKAEEKE